MYLSRLKNSNVTLTTDGWMVPIIANHFPTRNWLIEVNGNWYDDTLMKKGKQTFVSTNKKNIFDHLINFHSLYNLWVQCVLLDQITQLSNLMYTVL